MKPQARLHAPNQIGRVNGLAWLNLAAQDDKCRWRSVPKTTSQKRSAAFSSKGEVLEGAVDKHSRREMRSRI